MNRLSMTAIKSMIPTALLSLIFCSCIPKNTVGEKISKNAMEKILVPTPIEDLDYSLGEPDYSLLEVDLDDAEDTEVLKDVEKPENKNKHLW